MQSTIAQDENSRFGDNVRHQHQRQQRSPTLSQPRQSPQSIWAPQPQPQPNELWPRSTENLVDFGLFGARQQLLGHFQHSLQSSELTAPPPVVTRQDVFGPSDLSKTSSGEMGAVGDGRTMKSPELEQTHVEQLLRTLHLDSPDPYGYRQLPSYAQMPRAKPALNINVDNSPVSPWLDSPDFSPTTASSAPLTPADSSPHIFASKQLPPNLYYTPHISGPYSSQQSLLEHSPTRHGFRQSPTSSQFQHDLRSHALYSQAAEQTALSTFKPFADQPSSYPSPAASSHIAPLQPSSTLYQSPPSDILSRHSPPAISSRRFDGYSPSVGLGLNMPSTMGELSTDWKVVQPRTPPSESYPFPPSGDWIRGDMDPTPRSLRRGLPGLHSSGSIDDQFSVVPGRSFPATAKTSPTASFASAHEPINFLSLLHPSSSPPYHSFVTRIIKSSDQQASIFLQQKLKVADATDRAKIVDAICSRGYEMMSHRFGNWAVQRCLEAASTTEERRKIVSCMQGRVVELATNCYGCHVLQKALDCEEDIRLLIVTELLLGDPAQTLVNKHASHVWSKVMELTWTAPAPPIFSYVNKSLKGKWAALACHETGSLVVQHAFENLEDAAKDGIVDELLSSGPLVFNEVAKNQWGSYCIQHILEHGSEHHRRQTLDHLVTGLLEFSANEQGFKSVTKALKEGGKESLDLIVKRMCEPARSGSRRPMIVDMALSVNGSQLIASVLPSADKDQRAMLYDCIKGHIVTLRGCKTGSKVIWLFDRMRAYYGY